MKRHLAIGRTDAQAVGAIESDLRRMTLPLSALAHAVLVTAALVLPAVLTTDLPVPATGWITVAVAWPRANAEKATLGSGAGAGGGVQPLRTRRTVTIPRQTRAVATAKEENASERAFTELLEENPGGGTCVGVCSGTGAGNAKGVSEPTLPPNTPTREPVRAGRGGLVKEPRKVKHVDPVYPALARVARIQGRVVLDCVLGSDGAVQEIAVLEGNPLLAPAAVSAVREWHYTPTLLNGERVAVRLSVVVDFRVI